MAVVPETFAQWVSSINSETCRLRQFMIVLLQKAHVWKAGAATRQTSIAAIAFSKSAATVVHFNPDHHKPHWLVIPSVGILWCIVG